MIHFLDEGVKVIKDDTLGVCEIKSIFIRRIIIIKKDMANYKEKIKSSKPIGYS